MNKKDGGGEAFGFLLCFFAMPNNKEKEEGHSPPSQNSWCLKC